MKNGSTEKNVGSNPSLCDFLIRNAYSEKKVAEVSSIFFSLSLSPPPLSLINGQGFYNIMRFFCFDLQGCQGL